MAAQDAQSSGAEWTGDEVRTLLRVYPTGGAKTAALALPGRSLAAIYDAARELGAYRTGSRRVRRPKVVA